MIRDLIITGLLLIAFVFVAFMIYASAVAAKRMEEMEEKMNEMRDYDDDWYESE